MNFKILQYTLLSTIRILVTIRVLGKLLSTLIDFRKKEPRYLQTVSSLLGAISKFCTTRQPFTEQPGLKKVPIQLVILGLWRWWIKSHDSWPSKWQFIWGWNGNDNLKMKWSLRRSSSTRSYYWINNVNNLQYSSLLKTLFMNHHLMIHSLASYLATVSMFN